MYTVKEIFYTLQGEGANAGRPAVFCRFSGCNLWTGREADRATAICDFCDTDFVGVGPDGGKFATAEALADAVASRWPARTTARPLRRLHRRRAAAAARRKRRSTRSTPRVRRRRRNERDAGSAAGHRLDLREPQGPRRAACFDAATSSSLCFRNPVSIPSGFRVSSSSILPAADGRPRLAGEHAGGDGLLSAASLVASERPDPQGAGDQIVSCDVRHSWCRYSIALLTCPIERPRLFTWPAIGSALPP